MIKSFKSNDCDHGILQVSTTNPSHLTRIPWRKTLVRPFTDDLWNRVNDAQSPAGNIRLRRLITDILSICWHRRTKIDFSKIFPTHVFTPRDRVKLTSSLISPSSATAIITEKCPVVLYTMRGEISPGQQSIDFGTIRTKDHVTKSNQCSGCVDNFGTRTGVGYGEVTWSTIQKWMNY